VGFWRKCFALHCAHDGREAAFGTNGRRPCHCRRAGAAQAGAPTDGTIKPLPARRPRSALRGRRGVERRCSALHCNLALHCKEDGGPQSGQTSSGTSRTKRGSFAASSGALEPGPAWPVTRPSRCAPRPPRPAPPRHRCSPVPAPARAAQGSPTCPWRPAATPRAATPQARSTGLTAPQRPWRQTTWRRARSRARRRRPPAAGSGSPGTFGQGVAANEQGQRGAMAQSVGSRAWRRRAGLRRSGGNKRAGAGHLHSPVGFHSQGRLARANRGMGPLLTRATRRRGRRPLRSRPARAQPTRKRGAIAGPRGRARPQR
jgi:hypothetical protein